MRGSVKCWWGLVMLALLAAVASADCDEPMPVASMTLAGASAGESYTLIADGFLFTAIDFVFAVDRNATVMLRVTSIRDAACIDATPLDGAYQVMAYERIDHVGVGPGNISRAFARIEVPSAAADDLRVLSYNGTWQAVPLRPGERDENRSAYLAPVGGGLYAIAVVEGAEPLPGRTPILPADAGSPKPPLDFPTRLRQGIPWYSALTVGIIAAVLIIYFLIDRARHPHRRKERWQNPTKREPLIGIPVFDEKAFEHPLDKAREYVRQELRRGRSRERIVAALHEGGWSRKAVDKALYGVLEEDLGPSSAADRYSERSLRQLRAFLSEQRADGSSDGDIRTHLLAAGWDEDVVRELMRRED